MKALTCFTLVVLAASARADLGFDDAEAILVEPMDTTVDPCVDFFKYACGNWKSNHSTLNEMDYISIMNTRTWNLIGEELKDMPIDSPDQPSSFRKAKYAFDICMGDTPSSDKDKELKGIRDLLMSFGGWPSINRTSPLFPRGPEGLLGSLLGQLGLSSPILQPQVLPDVWNPGRNALFLAPPEYGVICNQDGKNCTLDIPHHDYYAHYYMSIAHRISDHELDPSQLRQDANEFATLLNDIAMASFNSLNQSAYPRDTMYILNNWYHPYVVSEAIKQWPTFNWVTFLMGVAENNTNVLNAFGYPFVVAVPGYMDTIAKLFHSRSPRQWQNFMMFGLAATEAQYLPALRDIYLKYDPKAQNRYYRGVRIPNDGEQPTPESKCAQQIERLFPEVLGRIFVDAVQMSRHDIDELSTMIGITLNAWHGMIKEVPWISEKSRQAAYEKIATVARKVAFPDWILNDDALDQSLALLDIHRGQDSLVLINKAMRYAVNKQLSQVGAATDRYMWQGSPAILNAWYMPVYNSITFTAAIMQSPYFNHKFPKSFNYAHVGLVMGHELGHAFDTNGIFWGPEGEWVPNTWVDDQSLAGYETMAECLVDEYSQFCYPSIDACVNGNRTITENIADNGGMNAAYRSYHAILDLMGGEAAYTGPLKDFTPDQRFFLSYANTWCSNQPDWLVDYLIHTDVHSPDQYRVTGVLLNMPEFASAFSCPAGSPMAPVEHCSVWVKPH